MNHFPALMALGVYMRTMARKKNGQEGFNKAERVYQAALKTQRKL